MGKSANLARVVDADGGIGYQTGRGGTVTQATSKSTAVTLNKLAGRITLNGAALAANTAVTFQFNNSLAGAADVLVVSASEFGGANEDYVYTTMTIGAGGGFYVSVRNVSGGSLSQAVQLNFVVIKGATA